jgi:hypothetical protein
MDLETAHGDLLHGNAFAEGGRMAGVRAVAYEKQPAYSQ